MKDSFTSSGRKKYNVLENTEILPARMQLVLEKLKQFYKNGTFESIVLPIIEERKPIALRDIDWLVTNYSKAFPVIYQCPMDINGEPFNVHSSYEKYEDVWKKRLFDPFQRGQRIYYEANGKKYETTVAQLNFFQWAIKFGVIDWAVRHKEAIKKHHDETKKARQELIANKPDRVKKRMRLTPVNNSNCIVYVQPMRVNLSHPSNQKKVIMQESKMTRIDPPIFE